MSKGKTEKQKPSNNEDEVMPSTIGTEKPPIRDGKGG